MSKMNSRKRELKPTTTKKQPRRKEIIEEIILEKFLKLVVMNFQIERAQVPSTMNENRPTLRPTTIITQNTGSKKLVGEAGMITDRSRSQNQGQESE